MPCTHEFTEANCSSGSWSKDRVFQPSPWVCATCKAKACDDCQETWKVCQACGDAICDLCAISGISRRVMARETTTEYLCRPCATAQAKARGELKYAVEEALAAINKGADWLDVIVSELEDAIARAKRSL